MFGFWYYKYGYVLCSEIDNFFVKICMFFIIRIINYGVFLKFFVKELISKI